MRFLLLILLTLNAHAETIRVEIQSGTAVQIATPLTIQQEGQPTINLSAASYATNPFGPGAAPYYDFRIGLWNDDQTAGWEFELLHNKLYLLTMPPEVQQFQITFGYNMLFINRAITLDRTLLFGPHWLILRAGLGAVIAHAISTVRNQTYDGATYSLAGIAYQLALQARVPIVGNLYGSGELKWTGASATVPIENGVASVPNNGVHFLVGVGLDF